MEKYFDINLPGISIKAKLYANPKTEIEKAVICCHGFCGSKESAFNKHLAEKLLGKEKHAALLCFDWPCHGNDVRKKITLDLCITYLQAAIGYARD
ncbi:MAG: alpha/beta hydrolase, partial [Oscillospiraceae bacterium]|nr:alpha/beta hydrolase [Oscillospiraceae bacterium]